MHSIAQDVALYDPVIGIEKLVRSRACFRATHCLVSCEAEDVPHKEAELLNGEDMSSTTQSLKQSRAKMSDAICHQLQNL